MSLSLFFLCNFFLASATPEFPFGFNKVSFYLSILLTDETELQAEPLNSVSFFPVLSPQFGAAGVQRFTAADDWCSFRDGPWDLTNKFALHGRSACW